MNAIMRAAMRTGRFGLRAVERLVQRQLRAEQNLVGLTDAADFFFAQTRPPQSDEVQSTDFHRRPDVQQVRSHVLVHAGHAADHRQFADPRILMHDYAPGHERAVPDLDVAPRRAPCWR